MRWIACWYPERGQIRHSTPAGYGQRINLARLVAGSEGTLCFITEAKLNLVEVPPAAVGVVCVHTTSLAEALHANRVAMQHAPKASELVDKYIMDFTKEHHEYSKNRFFLEGDPAAMLLVEFWGDTEDEVQTTSRALTEDLKKEALGYAYPLLVWRRCYQGLGYSESRAWANP